ncbi:hypothetical protein BDN70DRAFT_872296 [Pholiota conissans]|uniref:F-box domain-containing protein n=1 Tax=Pholiota conissans TaxID=109636 RepID=A0A9P6D5H7_9AGAR|nr:hypothetical protein BDN70DRAFT_872296 [Pholiota conissans]
MSSPRPNICDILPPEIFTLIFEFACYRSYDERCHVARRVDSMWGPNEEEIWDPSVTPLIIGAVCSHWRSITLSEPRLWRQIDVPVNTDRADARANMLQYFLFNSGQHSLDVRLLYKSEDNPDEYSISESSPLPTTAIEILVPHSHRLHTLETIAPFEWEDALNRLANHLSMLTRLTLRNYNTPSRYRFDFFANAPRLRDVTLYGIHLDSVKLPFAQLERFDFDPNDKLDSLEPLRRCPHLRHCALVSVFRSSRIKHLALETLEIYSDYSDHLKALLQILELPALRTLLIHFHPYFEEVEQPIVREFFQRSPCALESLTLIYATPDEREFLALLQELPTLRVLRIHNNLHLFKTGTLTPKSLRLMTPRKSVSLISDDEGLEGEEQDPSEPCLVPNLETFHYEGHLGIALNALLEFLEGRWCGGNTTVSKLQSVWFATRPRVEFDESDAVIVDRLREEGMHLEFLVAN